MDVDWDSDIDDSAETSSVDVIRSPPVDPESQPSDRATFVQSKKNENPSHQVPDLDSLPRMVPGGNSVARDTRHGRLDEIRIRPCLTLPEDTDIISSNRHDYALLPVESSALLANISTADMVLRRTHVIETDPCDNAKVVSLTASGGQMTGTLDGTPSYTRLPNSPLLQEVYTVQFDGPLAKGDSGSWVLDRTSGGLYGHIVAGSADQGIAYIVPAREVFADVKERLHRDHSADSDLILEALHVQGGSAGVTACAEASDVSKSATSTCPTRSPACPILKAPSCTKSPATSQRRHRASHLSPRPRSTTKTSPDDVWISNSSINESDEASRARSRHEEGSISAKKAMRKSLAAAQRSHQSNIATLARPWPDIFSKPTKYRFLPREHTVY